MASLVVPGSTNAVGAFLGTYKFGYTDQWCNMTARGPDGCRALVLQLVVTMGDGGVHTLDTSDPATWQARVGQSISTFYITRLLFKMACKQNLDLRCVLISDPGTLGAGAKVRLHTPKAVTYHEQPHYCRFMIGHSLGRMESRIKKFTPHCVCRPRGVGSFFSW